MSTITLPKIEYQDLKRKAAMFERIVELAGCKTERQAGEEG